MSSPSALHGSHWRDDCELEPLFTPRASSRPASTNQAHPPLSAKPAQCPLQSHYHIDEAEYIPPVIMATSNSMSAASEGTWGTGNPRKRKRGDSCISLRSSTSSQASYGPFFSEYSDLLVHPNSKEEPDSDSETGLFVGAGPMGASDGGSETNLRVPISADPKEASTYDGPATGPLTTHPWCGISTVPPGCAPVPPVEVSLKGVARGITYDAAIVLHAYQKRILNYAMETDTTRDLAIDVNTGFLSHRNQLLIDRDSEDEEVIDLPGQEEQMVWNEYLNDSSERWAFLRPCALVRVEGKPVQWEELAPQAFDELKKVLDIEMPFILMRKVLSAQQKEIRLKPEWMAGTKGTGLLDKEMIVSSMERMVGPNRAENPHLASFLFQLPWSTEIGIHKGLMVNTEQLYREYSETRKLTKAVRFVLAKSQDDINKFNELMQSYQDKYGVYDEIKVNWDLFFSDITLPLALPQLEPGQRDIVVIDD